MKVLKKFQEAADRGGGGNFDAVISLVNDYCAKKGVKFEAYLFDSKVLKMESENGEVSNFTNAETSGLNLRLYSNKKVSFSYCLGLEEQKIINALDNAASLLKFMDENEYFDFAAKEESGQVTTSPEKLGIYSGDFESIGIEEKKLHLAELEETAYSYDKKIYKVDKPTYSETLISKRFYNSNGLDRLSKKTFYEIFLSVASRNGADTGSGSDFDFAHSFGALKFKKTAMNAAKKGVDQLGAGAAASGNYDVIFDNFTSSELLSILKQSFYSNNVFKKKSLLEGKLEKKVFSDKIDIIDDGLLYGGTYSDVFDGEGVDMQKKVLCASGVVKSFLYDIEYANRFGVKSTGNSSGRSFTLPPDVGSTNFFIKNGDTMLIDIISSMKEGLYINELMGLHMAKPYTGEFSLGASGFYIDKGRIGFPVKGIVLSGNLMELFNGAAKIADDIRYFGSTGSPSILFENVRVSGK